MLNIWKLNLLKCGRHFQRVKNCKLFYHMSSLIPIMFDMMKKYQDQLIIQSESPSQGSTIIRDSVSLSSRVVLNWSRLEHYIGLLDVLYN